MKNRNAAAFAQDNSACACVSPFTARRTERMTFVTATATSLVVCISLLAAPQVLAQADATHEFVIAAQPLDAALKAFAQQAQREIFFTPELTRGKQTRGINGRLQDLAALNSLLDGTGLSYTITQSNAILLRPVNEAGESRSGASLNSTAADNGSGDLGEVVITGSRVITDGNNSPTPVTVIAADDIKTVQPTTIADGLNLMPVFSGSRTPTSNPLTTGGAGGGSAASNQLNLRNVGSLRTLVLFDGQRVPPTLINGNVDVDMIPQMLLKRVDMVTGGVSAVYGSDAVTGVVNFITDTHFNGIKANAQYGVSEYSDNKQYNFGVAFGTDIAGGIGHFEGSYEYRDAQGILKRSARPWNRLYAVEGAGTTASPYRLVENIHLATLTFGGLVTGPVPSATVANPLYDQHFATNGTLRAFVHGGASGSVCCEVGGDGAYYDSSMLAPLKSHQVFLRTDFDFTDDLKWHAVAAANFKDNLQNFIYPSLNNVTLSAQNAFLGASYQQQLSSSNRTTFTLSKLMTQRGSQQTITDSTQYYFNTGLEGGLGDYRWAVDFNYGQTRLQNEITGRLNNQRLSAALDVVNGPSGPVCYAATQAATAGAYANCVPLNVFGPTSSSDAALDYILSSLHYTGRTRSYDVAAHIAGDPFATWAGPVSMALSGEWRRLSYQAVSDTLPTDRADCADGILRFNCNANTLLWNLSLASFPKVSQTVKEAALEAEVPLVKDVPLIQSLSLNGAGRYTSYNTSGNYWTWKLGADWHLNDSLRLRATQSSDIRAPTLSDLFAPQSVNIVAVEDLLTRQTPSVPSYGGGNPNLSAEKGRTTTAGLVWRPAALPGFSVAVDYFHVRITDAITAQGGFGATFQIACYASGGSSPYCALQQRPLNSYTNTSIANTVTAWSGRAINISEIETNGADFEVNYQGRAFDRRFSLRGLVTYQPHIYYRQPSIPTIDMGGLAYGPTPLVASPSLRVTGMLSFEATEKLRIDVIERWRNAMKMGDPSLVWLNNRVSSFGTTGLNLNYSFKTTAQPEVFLNIQNLFDKKPPPAGQYGSGTVPGQFGGWAIGDDPVGRYYTAGIRIRL